MSKKTAKSRKEDSVSINLNQKTNSSFQTEESRKIMMWALVLIFMVFILFVWGFNIKKSFQAASRNKGESDVSITEIRDQFSQAMSDISVEFEKIRQQEENIQASNELIQSLKNNLENVTTSTEEDEVNQVATSSIDAQISSTTRDIISSSTNASSTEILENSDEIQEILDLRERLDKLEEKIK